MATKTQSPTPFSRFSRLGLGLGLKSPSTSQHQTRLNEQVEDFDDDEWYIPYNGPYELPHAPIRERKGEGSWGDPFFGGESDGILGDQELHDQYGVDVGHDGWNGNMGYREKVYGSSETRARERSHSFASGRTVSSGAIDPSRSGVANRRSTVSSGRQLLSVPGPSFIGLGAAGGIGESPMPPPRPPKETTSQNRNSVSNFFAFGSQSRKTPTSPAFRNDTGAAGTTSRPLGPVSKGPTLLRRLSPGRASPKKRSKRVPALPLNTTSSRDSMATDEEDYYNSYYSTLINTPASSKTRSSRPDPNESSNNNHLSGPDAKTRPHPYAYMHYTPSVPPTPHTAPPMPTPKIQFVQSGPASSSHDPPIVTLTKSSEVNLGAPQSSSLVGGLRRLKNSMSTPNLQSTLQPPQNSSQAYHIPRGKERWLSAETWCDVLLPRPRFKLKQIGDSEYIGSGRIVSPPGSPVREVNGNGWTEKDDRNNGLPSRVLAHSRSLAELQDDFHKILDPSTSSPSKTRSRGTAVPSQSRHSPSPLPPPTSVAARPKSFALDDLALPSPVPSLARVLQDGQVLESQRRQWNTQATESFQNKRSRDISRARSRSLSQKQRKDDGANHVRYNIDFLAARSLLGNQDIIPVTGSAAPKSESSSTNHTTSVGKSSHSHSNSLVKTISKSSKSQSRHSKNDSWGKSAIKMAKTTMCGLIGDSSLLSPLDEKACALENALRGDGTRVIKLVDPVHLSANVDSSGPSHITTPARSGISPSPSGVSDVVVGIALSTPPLEEALDRESIRLPAHPYAQGGLYTVIPQHARHAEPRPEQGSAYAGPHPSSAVVTQSPEPTDMASRHRLPPHAVHPFASVSPHASDPITPRDPVRPDIPASSNKPPSEGRVGLSTQVRSSSPGAAESSSVSEPFHVSLQARNSRPILDTSGVGEALTNALRSKRSINGLNVYLGNAPIRDGAVGLGHEEPSYFNAKPTAASTQYPPRPSHLQFDSKNSGHDSLSPADASASSGPSPDATSDSSSPQHSPLPLGSPDDLDHFHDLFFKPSSERLGLSERNSGSLSRNPSVPWDISTRSHRTGSGLTSLARQLSEEFEQITSESRGSQSSASARLHSAHGSRRPTDSGLEFVFEEMPHLRSDSPLQNDGEPMRDSSFVFRPSGVVPEDVDSPTEEEDEDVTEIFHVRRVEAVSTPPATRSDHRNSLAGRLSFIHDHDDHSVQHAIRHLTDSTSPTSLQPSSGVLTRSSYLTSSTGSRMSGLSDFPTPPRDSRPGHISLLSSYFNEVHSQSDTQTPPTPQNQSRRLTFGGGSENVEDIIAALSPHI